MVVVWCCVWVRIVDCVWLRVVVDYMWLSVMFLVDVGCGPLVVVCVLLLVALCWWCVWQWDVVTANTDIGVVAIVVVFFVG